jgi:hypothetical protein
MTSSSLLTQKTICKRQFIYCIGYPKCWELMYGEVEQGIKRFGGILEGRPRPTPGCSAIEEEEEDI